MKVRWTEYAVSDLVGIRDYIARDSEAYAGIVADRILSRVRQLQNFPESGQMVPEYGREDIRELFVHSYRIIHQVLPEEIRVITVVHGANPLPPATPNDG